jgi:pimeloyl-ACP methyl ester carboxylesterase
MNADFATTQIVIALHCSGASGRQWQRLGERLFPYSRLITPDLIGYGSNAPADPDIKISLSDEAAGAISMIDRSVAPVHLVGHSYGGAVALRAALDRPNQIASLTLYEPSAFRLLRDIGTAGAAAHRDITDLADTTRASANAGRDIEAMRVFYDYWQGAGAWEKLSPEARVTLATRATKVPLDFDALLGDGMQSRHLSHLKVPTLVLVGQHAPQPSRLVAERVARIIPKGRLIEIVDAGHMGPITHRDIVAGIMSEHIRRAIGGVDVSLPLAA